MIYGLFIIVPAAILFLLLVKLTEILEKVAVPLGMESSFGAAIALLIIVVVAIAVILLFGWIIGSLMRRVISYEAFESSLLNETPAIKSSPISPEDSPKARRVMCLHSSSSRGQAQQLWVLLWKNTPTGA